MKWLLFLAWTVVTSSLVHAGDTAPKSRVVKVVSAGELRVVVDTMDAPDLEKWGLDAAKLCINWLPKIAALLPSDGFTPAKQVELRFDPALKGVAHAANGRITISSAWVKAHPEDNGMVVHELTHLVQAYPAGGPGWLVEGIADYIRIVHYEPKAPRPKVNRLNASYRDAYKTTAIFLEWTEKHHSKDLVLRLNQALRSGSYNDDLWKAHTGRSVDEMWALFIQSL